MRVPDRPRICHRRRCNNFADVYSRQRWIRIAQMINDKLSHDRRE